jgi:hypothetical protein
VRPSGSDPAARPAVGLERPVVPLQVRAGDTAGDLSQSGLVYGVMHLAATALAAILWLAPAARASTCAGPLPVGPPGLPAPVLIGVPCGTYALAPDGTVAAQKPAPTKPRAGEWLAMRGSHVVLLYKGRVVWRSRRAFEQPFVEGGPIGARDLAFSFAHGRLWLASRHGAEHAVAKHEDPLGWTAANELLTARWSRNGGTLRVRSENGARPQVFARRVTSLAFDDASTTLVYVDPRSGMLTRTAGRRGAKLVALDDLGVPWATDIGLLPDGLLDFQAPDRIVVLRGDGSVFASSLLPDTARSNGWIEWAGWPVAGGHRLAFAVADRARARESVYVLREGARIATPVFEAADVFEQCGSYEELAWHGDWLLYSTLQDTGEGSGEPALTALDTTLAHPPLDLTGVVRALPGMGPDENGVWPGVSARWG